MFSIKTTVMNLFLKEVISIISWRKSIYKLKRFRKCWIKSNKNKSLVWAANLMNQRGQLILTGRRRATRQEREVKSLQRLLMIAPDQKQRHISEMQECNTIFKKIMLSNLWLILVIKMKESILRKWIFYQTHRYKQEEPGLYQLGSTASKRTKKLICTIINQAELHHQPRISEE